MSQADFLRAFDASAFAAFATAGLADAAHYLPAQAAPGTLPVRCGVLVDRSVQDFGDELAPVAVPRTLITLQKAEVSAVQFGTVQLLDALGQPQPGEMYDLVKLVREDESITRWEVQHAEPA
ncbi:hypothetical protein [Xanthomonas sp. XNM01]|uniref:hypothetical protein n=1 Tax=Xanthomonas sp. XNM01 TaxID=2769289 RepID=UPI00177F49F8|nr:hypothetical protein [Xanthomonas sp. XNM01]MBD9368856.1 hypothetical protein [Xanthomonas sp. XNM01]